MSVRDLLSFVASERDQELKKLDLLPQAREAWMRKKPTPVRAPREWLALGGYSLAGAAAAAALLFATASKTLRYETVGLQPAPGALHGTLQPERYHGGMMFSDGSMVTLVDGARAGVGTLGENGATIRLDRGKLEAHIVPRRSSQWLFQAGAFEVQVTGTQFDPTWNDDKRELTLRMRDGSVLLQGCAMHPVAVSAGESVRIRCGGGGAEQVTEYAPPAAASVAQPEPPEPPAASGSAIPLPSPISVVAAEEADGEATAESPPEWRAHLGSGRLREAYSTAESSGFDAACDSSSGPELLALADAAAYSGRADRATTALLAARRRFGGTAVSSMAAFKLGRLAFDSRGATGEARQWFTSYLQEAPGGSLAQEAMGRLIEIDKRSGDMNAARTRATEYLRRYPEGPHAPLARSVVSP